MNPPTSVAEAVNVSEWDEDTRLVWLGFLLDKPSERRRGLSRMDDLPMVRDWLSDLERDRPLRMSVIADLLASFARQLAQEPTAELFHFTSEEAWRDIERDGAVRPWQPSIGRAELRRFRRAAGELEAMSVGWIAKHPVVWLTTHPSAEGIATSVGEPDVRITVRVPTAQVHPWLTWAIEQDIPRALYPMIVGELFRGRDYYVIERPIPLSEWVDVCES